MGFLDSVRGFAEKVGDTVEKGAKSVSENSKKLAEKTRIKKEISQLENDITNAYIEIGKKYFAAHEAEPEPEYADAISNIKTKTERADKFRLLLNSLEDKQPCANCGADILRGQRFCDKCGAKVEPAVIPTIEGYNDTPETQNLIGTAPDVKKICANCGAEASDPDQVFCEKCGTRFGEVPAPAADAPAEGGTVDLSKE